MKKEIGAVVMFCILSLVAVAQTPSYLENFVVFASDDTVAYKSIDFSKFVVTCSNGSSKDKHDNETIRSFYYAQKQSDFADFFTYYGKLKKSKLFPLSTSEVAQIVTAKRYPEFYDFLPTNPDQNFFQRSLFLVLAYNNEHKLLALKTGTGKKEKTEFYVFKEYEAKGILLTKKNINTTLRKVFGTCPVLNNADDKESGFFVNPDAFLQKIYKSCSK